MTEDSLTGVSSAAAVTTQGSSEGEERIGENREGKEKLMDTTNRLKTKNVTTTNNCVNLKFYVVS